MEEVIDRVSQAGAFKLVPVICKRGFQGRSKIEEKMERWHRLFGILLVVCGIVLISISSGK